MDITNYVWIRFLQKKWLTSYELTGCEVTNHIRILLYHFNPQGDEYEKSIIAFAEDTKINRKGMFAIYRAIARAFGKDKLTDNDKVQWFMENRETLNPAEAKEPHIARALLISLDRAKKENKTNIMVELD